jgi:hypothetical protein
MRLLVRSVLAVVLPLCLLNGARAEKPRVMVTGDNASIIAEGIKLAQSECHEVTLNTRSDLADYVMAVSDDGSGAGRKGRRAVVTKPNGDIVATVATRSLKNAVKDACGAIAKDWPQAQSQKK